MTNEARPTEDHLSTSTKSADEFLKQLHSDVMWIELNKLLDTMQKELSELQHQKSPFPELIVPYQLTLASFVTKVEIVMLEIYHDRLIKYFELEKATS